MFVLMPFQVGVGTTPALFKGRLYHLKGKFNGSPSAAELYQMARLSNQQLQSAQMTQDALTAYILAKLNASFWLGLIAAHENNARSAIDYFETRTLGVAPNSPWTHGAKYNLARVYEASGRAPEAIKLYRADTRSPCYHGNVLRARWLESLAGKPAEVEKSEKAEADNGEGKR